MNIDERTRRTRTAIFYNVGGTILPFLIVVIILSLFMKLDKISTVLDRGDFCIYSVGLFVSALFLFNENRGDIKNSLDYWLYNSIIYMIIFAAIIYAGVYIKDIILENGEISIWLVRIFSLLLFIISIITSYRALNIENLKHTPNVNIPEIQENVVDNIINEMEEL